jgi:hypothetical protein
MSEGPPPDRQAAPPVAGKEEYLSILSVPFWPRVVLSKRFWLLLLVVGAAAFLVWWDQRGWTVARLERRIKSEVPPGCGRAEVETWLHRQGIRHSYWQDTTGDRRGEHTMPMLAGLDSKDLSGMVRGEIAHSEGANVNWIFPGDISMYFFFDKQGRLVGHLVDPFVYMP